MKTIAITGGIGSGKSTVASILAERPGVRVVNADDEAKRLMVEDEALPANLIKRFGADTFLDDGSLNRSRLAEKVFGDPEELLALNALVHPVVRNSLVDSIKVAEKDGIELFVYDVALITEINIADIFDAVVLVDAPLETRIERVMARNNMSQEDVLARVSNQRPPSDLRPLADFVVQNAGELEELRNATDQLFHTILGH